MSTVDPNASKPSRRRVTTASVDPRVEDASGSIERGSGRARGRTQRSATIDSAGKDPLARLVALDEGRPDTEIAEPPMPDIVPAERPSRPPAPPVAEIPVVPMVRTTTIDAAIPTGAMPAVETPVAPTVERSAPVIAAPMPAPVAETAPAAVVEERRGSRPVIWRRTGRPRVRRVTRVLRHIDTWSVFKVALVFNLVAYLVTLTAAVLLWNVAYRTGTIDNVEQFFEQFGWSSFEFRGGELYHNLWIAGLFVAVGLTGFAVMLATLFNLITDLVGGIRVSVLEEEVITRAAQRPTGDRAAPASSAEPPPPAATSG